MSKGIKISVTAPDQIIGSASYTVSVGVNNYSTSDIDGVEVEPLFIEGRLLTSQVEVKDAEEDQLDSRRRAIIEEMEAQVNRAYERQSIRSLSKYEMAIYVLAQIFDVYASVFIFRRLNLTMIPAWTHEAFRIHSWEDVEMLEHQYICEEKENSNLRKAFLIDKEKLKRCMKSLSEKSVSASPFETGTLLSPEASVSFPFTIKAPHLLRQRSADLQFKVTYRDVETGKTTTESVTKRVTLLPSEFSVPTGAMIGAASGYAIKIALGNPNPSHTGFRWFVLIGSIFLGLVIALLTSRKPDTYKIITVEDFLGGFVIGALTGMFSEVAIEHLRTLFAS